MTGRRAPAGDPPAHDPATILVDAHWRARVGGIAAPALCSVRAASDPDIRAASELLHRAGCDDATLRHARGINLLLLAWLDPDRLPAAPGSTRGRAAGQTPPGALWPAGCLDIDWSGPREDAVRADAGECVELGRLYVDRAARGHGVGHTLVAAAEQHCLAAGRTRVVAALRPGAGDADVEGVLAAAGRAGYGPLPISGRGSPGTRRARRPRPAETAAGGPAEAGPTQAADTWEPPPPAGADSGPARDPDTPGVRAGHVSAVVWVWKDIPELGGPYPTRPRRR